MANIFMDYEAFSCVNLKKSNVYAYVEDPTFEILIASYSIDGGPVRRIVGERRIRDWFAPLWADESNVFVAWNAGFERITSSALLGLPPGTYLDPERWIDPAAIAAELGLPRQLGKCAKAVGAVEKDEAGTRLINLFSKPVRGKRITGSDKPEEWLSFGDYCDTDVEVLIDVVRRLPGGWPTDLEQRLWAVDQRINDRGIAVDLELAAGAVQIGDRLKAKLMAEAIEITGLKNPNSIIQLKGWLADNGVDLPDMQADTITEVVDNWDLPDDVVRVLEIRQGTALAAVKKFDAALAHTCADGRFRGSLRFFAAHTGRWGGVGPQVQNLPRDTVEDVEAEIARVKAHEEVSQQVLKALVRSMLVGPFTIVDYRAIEACVLAWLAGEQWVLEGFLAGRDMYVETAARMGDYTRNQGKVADLALGFGGAKGALRKMGAEGTDEELNKMKDLWRGIHPKTTAFWRAVDLGFAQGGRAGRIRFEKVAGNVEVTLPSGRTLIYRNVRRFYDPVDGWSITYDDPRGFRTDTWYGSLVENIVQATARELLAAALVRLDERGYPVVFHVHDEAVIDGLYDIEEISKIMCELPDWATGLPLSAEGQQSERYVK